MTKLKKMMAILLTILTVTSVLTVVAYAANTTNSSYQISVKTTSDYTHVDPAREKDNKSPVYFYAEKSYVNNSNIEGAPAVRVMVYGTTGASAFDSGSNCTLRANDLNTIAPYVTCAVGVRYKIHSLVYESVNTDIKYAFISIANATNAINYSTIEGVWSPDCTNNSSYQDAE